MAKVMHPSVGTLFELAAGPVPVVTANVLKQQGLTALDQLPPFSPILNKLMVSLSGDDVSFALLGDLIEKDAVLAGRMLAMVNSALYAQHSTISSVRQALGILGREKVRNMVLGMSVSCTLDQARAPSGFSVERFNKHSAAVAILSDLIAQRVPVEYPEGAFVAGLLHDIGRLLIAIGLPWEFQRILHQYQTSALTWVECEENTLGFAHPELSCTALAAWRIPGPILVAVAEHHAPVPPQPGGEMSLGWVVNAANQYINSVGESILASRKPDGAGTAWMESLGLDREALAALYSDFQAEHSAMVQYFR